MKLRLVLFTFLIISGFIPFHHAQARQLEYGVLQGNPQVFRVKSDGISPLSLQILSPKISGTHTDFVARVTSMETNTVIATLDGTLEPWNSVFEPLSGDYYWQGPALNTVIPKGIYIVTVSNTDNQGGYLVTTGETGGREPKEIIRTLAILPKIKQILFHESWLRAVFNRSMIGISAGIIFLILCSVILRRMVEHHTVTGTMLEKQAVRMRPKKKLSPSQQSKAIKSSLFPPFH